MEATLRELAEALDPPMTPRQITALLAIAGIGPCGVRHTGRSGRPANTYTMAEVVSAHATEAARTAKQFADSDWLASALLARNMVTADTEAGAVWWADGGRAEELREDKYGWVKVGPCSVPAHRVIWIAAEGEIPAGLQVNHMNGLKWDNRRANLELVTIGNNVRHAYGLPYLNHHEASAALAELASDPTPPPGINPYGGNVVAGRLIKGPVGRPVTGIC